MQQPTNACTTLASTYRIPQLDGDCNCASTSARASAVTGAIRDSPNLEHHSNRQPSQLF